MPAFMNNYARKTIQEGMHLALTQPDPCVDNKIPEGDVVPDPDPQPKLKVIKTNTDSKPN